MQADDYDNKNEAGFINPKHNQTRVQKMKWTADNDSKLLLLGLGREISQKEYATIAASFKEQPTAKSIQERLTKLRAEQATKLTEMGLLGPTTRIHPIQGDGDDDDNGDDQDKSPFTTNDAAGALLDLVGGGSTTGPPKKKRRVSRKKTSTMLAGSYVDAAEDDDEVEMSQEQQQEKKFAEGRRNYAKQVAREKAEKEAEDEDEEE